VFFFFGGEKKPGQNTSKSLFQKPTGADVLEMVDCQNTPLFRTNEMPFLFLEIQVTNVANLSLIVLPCVFNSYRVSEIILTEPFERTKLKILKATKFVSSDAHFPTVHKIQPN